MGLLAAIFLIYGIFCIIVGVLKPPYVFKLKKIIVMTKMFKGEKNVQIFMILWGILFIVLSQII